MLMFAGKQVQHPHPKLDSSPTFTKEIASSEHPLPLKEILWVWSIIMIVINDHPGWQVADKCTPLAVERSPEELQLHLRVVQSIYQADRGWNISQVVLCSGKTSDICGFVQRRRKKWTCSNHCKTDRSLDDPATPAWDIFTAQSG